MPPAHRTSGADASPKCSTPRATLLALIVVMTELPSQWRRRMCGPNEQCETPKPPSRPGMFFMTTDNRPDGNSSELSVRPHFFLEGCAGLGLCPARRYRRISSVSVWCHHFSISSGRQRSRGSPWYSSRERPRPRRWPRPAGRRFPPAARPRARGDGVTSCFSALLRFRWAAPPLFGRQVDAGSVVVRDAMLRAWLSGFARTQHP